MVAWTNHVPDLDPGIVCPCKNSNDGSMLICEM